MTATRPEILTLSRIGSPVGDMLLVTDRQRAIRALDFADYETRMRVLLKRYGGAFDLQDGPAPKGVAAALAAYFAGDMAALDGLQVHSGGTDFQRAVWAALRTIPAGETWSYQRLAGAIGRETAMRAVGAANGANPVAIIVPCHRVIGANGTLTGYAGGLERKQWLLAHEADAVARLAA